MFKGEFAHYLFRSLEKENKAGVDKIKRIVEYALQKKNIQYNSDDLSQLVIMICQFYVTFSSAKDTPIHSLLATLKHDSNF